jgi:hypothetical protein
MVDATFPPAEPPVAVAEPIVMTTLIDDEVHEARLEVVDRLDRSVVTVIEILSPTNKIPGSRGRRSYQKRREVMQSPSHLVEIDLLNIGHCFGFRHSDFGFCPAESAPTLCKAV